MHCAIISGSTRAESESANVAAYLRETLKEAGDTAAVIDLFELNLPVFDATRAGDWTERWSAAQATLEVCDSCIFISPEWDGMMAPGLHNFLHYLRQELADKPVYLVGVSSGRGGRYPLLQMRQLGYKNKHFVIIPESIFIDQVTENLVAGELHNEHIKTRLEYGLRTLRAYADALQTVRASGVTDYERFPNGW